MTQERIDEPFTEEDEQGESEFDNAPGDEQVPAEFKAMYEQALEEQKAKPQPLTPATPTKEPPLFTPPTYVSARVDRDGFAMVEGERLFVGRSLAGARVNVEKRG